MQEPQQSQPVYLRGVFDLKEDEARVCDICGDMGREELLAICSKCTDGAEHIYCMRVKLDKVPQGWTCEECILGTETRQMVQFNVKVDVGIPKGCLEYSKSGSSVNLQSSSSLDLKSRSSCARGNKTIAASSISQLPAKRHAAPLESLTCRKARSTGMGAVTPMSSEPCKNLKIGKKKAANGSPLVLQISCNHQEKAKVPRVCGNKSNADPSEAELDEKQTLETQNTSPRHNKLSQDSLQSREHLFKDLGKTEIEATENVTSMRQFTRGTQERAELPSILGDNTQKLGSQSGILQNKSTLLKSRPFNSADLHMKRKLAKGARLQQQTVAGNPAFPESRRGKDSKMLYKSLSFDCVGSKNSNATVSDVLLVNASRSKFLKKISLVNEIENAKGNNMSELPDYALCLQSSGSGFNAITNKEDIMTTNETFSLGYVGHKLDFDVQSCGQSDYRLKPSSHFTHKDLNCSNEEKKHEGWQAQHSTGTLTVMELYELYTSLAFGDRFSYLKKLLHYAAGIPFQGSVIPKPFPIWLGKFRVHSCKEPARFFHGIQAHLSFSVAPQVLEVVDRLPETIVLEEVPQMKTWPSQFVERPPREDNIGLYFFATDLNSYSTYYERLVDHITKNNFALRGKIDDVELLIFPSSVLPKKSQRWITLYFLWGVFIKHKADNSANKPMSNSAEEKKGFIEGMETVNPNALSKDGKEIARLEGSDVYCFAISDSGQAPNQGKEETMNQSPKKSEEQIEVEIGHILVSMANGSLSI